MTLLGLTAAGTAAVIVAAAIVPAVHRWAARRRILAVPNERSLHEQPTPVGGGLAIVACVLLGLVIVDGARGWWSGFAAGALAVAVVSWWDDLRGLPVGARLIVHAAAAALVVLPLRSAFDSSAALIFVAIALPGIVGLCNAYNFMDGIDGIAAGQAIVAGIGWTWLGWEAGDAASAAVGALVAGASLGFLFYNWPPARIFMGDVGAAFLGFTFAALTAAALAQSVERAIAGLLFVWPFVFDTAFTLLRRAVRGENILRAHRSHIYQRLVASGWSHARVTALYSGLAALGVLVAMLLIV